MRRRTKTAAHFYVDTQSGGFWAHRDFPSAHSLTGRGGVCHVKRGAAAGLSESFFTAASIGRGQLLSQAIDRRGGTVLSGAVYTGRSRCPQRTGGAKPAPCGAHHQKDVI